MHIQLFILSTFSSITYFTSVCFWVKAWVKAWSSAYSEIVVSVICFITSGRLLT